MQDQLTLTERFEVELPHPESGLEWWFFHGFFEGKSIGMRSFMVSFFRYNVAKKQESPEPGYSVLFSILNHETGENQTISQIDEKVIHGLKRVFQSESDFELDTDLIKVLSEELDRFGPPHPILLKEVEGDSSGNKLFIKWENFTLRQVEDCFEIECPLLEEDVTCSLQLYPETGLFKFKTGIGSDHTEGEMAYHCYPELRLSGMVGDEEVTGVAWMDHQWGDESWFTADRKRLKLSAWDWFGINLEDGTNIIAVIQKYAKTGKEIYSRTVVMRNGEPPIFAEGLHMKPVEFWESPATHIKYPVAWNIDIDNLDLSLTFTPLVKDQEIPVFGMARAVWEGVGTVYGTMEGNAISGRARGEFHGYGYIFDFQNYLRELADRVDERIEEFFPKEMDEKVIRNYVGDPYWKNEPIAYTELISKPVWDLILRRGKRWRPIFGILMQEALGESSVNYERSWCLAELIHSGALIVDDIEDNSELRRGQPALHLKYGLDVALNAGNLLYFLPTVELFHHEHLDDKQKLKIHEIMMDTCLKGHFGQTLDIYWSNNMSSDNLSVWMKDEIEEKILQMYDYKTAAGPKGLVRVAAVLNDVSSEMEKVAVAFSRSFAVAFQIIDDVHNFSESPRWTKVRGEDIANGKLTFVIAKAIQLLDEKSSDRLIKILSDEKLRKQKAFLIEGIELVKQSGALEICRKEAQMMSMKAWDEFAEVVPSCEPKIMLGMLHRKMLDLAFDT